MAPIHTIGSQEKAFSSSVENRARRSRLRVFRICLMVVVFGMGVSEVINSRLSDMPGLL